MVQDYTAPVREYNYKFEYVMEAYEKRFDGENGCPDIPIIKKLDIIENDVHKNGHTIVRRCMIQPEIPGMLRRMMGIDQIFFCQKNVLDLSARRLEITAWNESFDNRVTVEEKCIYYAEGNRTKFSQSAKLKIHSFWGLESTVEKLMISQYKSSMKQGKEILEKHLKEMDSSLPPLDQLRMRLPSELVDLDDIYLERFLNSREGSIERATSAAKKYHEAKQTWQVDQIRTQDQPTQFKNNFPAKWLGNDLEGGPVLVIPWGKIAARKIYKSLGEDDIIKSVIRLIEKRPDPSIQFSTLIDCEDVCLRQGWASKPVLEMTMKMADVLSHLYPDSLRRVLLVRAPTPFPTIWTIVSPLIDERTRLKVYLYSGSELTKNLNSYLANDAIPTFLGGNGKFEAAVSDRDSGYASVNLPHEEIIASHADGSIVHWDIKKENSTNLSSFSITTSQGDTIDHANDNVLNEILSLSDEKVNDGESGACKVHSCPVTLRWEGNGTMGLFITTLPNDNLRSSVSSLESYNSCFSQISC